MQEPRRRVAVIVPVDLRLVGSSVREIIYSVITDLLDRFDAFLFVLPAVYYLSVVVEVG